jgi:hypothetical protein
MFIQSIFYCPSLHLHIIWVSSTNSFELVADDHVLKDIKSCTMLNAHIYDSNSRYEPSWCVQAVPDLIFNYVIPSVHLELLLCFQY